MNQPLQEFICDVCGKIVTPAQNDGYVIWTADEVDGRYLDHSWKIIHKGRCDLKDHESSLPLSDFVGIRGIVNLTSELSIGPIAYNTGDKSVPGIRDPNEFVDFFRRCQVPYYDEARQYFNTEDVKDRFYDANELAPYLPETLKSIIEREQK